MAEDQIGKGADDRPYDSSEAIAPQSEALAQAERLRDGATRVSSAVMDPVRTSACCEACSGERELAFVVGRLGFDFVNRTNRDTFIQPRDLPNPDDKGAMFRYFRGRGGLARAERLIWTVEVDEDPLYAIEPTGAFARDGYDRLVTFLGEQEIGEGTPEGGNGEKADRIIVPGFISGTTSLFYGGKQVEVIRPDITDLTNFSTHRIISAASEALSEDVRADTARMDNVGGLAAAMFDELRNPGRSAADRAKNFVVSSVAQMLAIFAEAIGLKYALEGVSVSPARIRPAGTDRWDVVVSFFSPEDQLNRASVEYTITVDVNYVMPHIVAVGPRRAKPTRLVL